MFNIFINCLKEGMNNGMTKVDDDAKLFIPGLGTGQGLNKKAGRKSLQDWRIKQQVKFNVDK